MRRVVLFGLPALFVLLLGAAAWYRLTFHGDALQAARARMAHGDMQGAELYLRQLVRQHPENAEAAYRLGVVDLALGNPSGAELELRRARTRGYDSTAIIRPLGQAMLEERHIDQILQEFDPNTTPAGTKGTVLSIRAAAQLAQRNVDAARASAAAAEAADPTDPQILLTTARVDLAADDLAGATTRIDRILAGDPKQLDAWLLRSDLALHRNDAAAALQAAETAASINPKRLDARLARARAEAALGRDKEARDAVEQVLRSAPRDLSANYLRTILALRHSDFAAADASLSVLSPVLGQLPRGLYFLAVAKMGIGQPAQAEEAAAKFLAQSPNDHDAIRLMAFIDLERGRPADALKLLRDTVEAGHADADTLDLYARGQTMTGDLKGASATLAKASAMAPSDTAILNRLAASKMNLGDTKAAEDDLRRSLALQPAQPGAQETLVQTALTRGDIAGARENVEQLRKAVGDTEAVGVMDAQVDIAAFDFNAADAKLRALLKRFPDSRPATLNLVRLSGLRGDHDGGETLLEGWLKNHPADEGALSLLMPALLADGKADRAVAIAEAAHAAAASNPAVTAALAAAYLHAKAPDRALALLDRAAVGNPGLEGARAEALVAANRPKEAAEAYKQMLDNNPAAVGARHSLALLQLAAGDADGARATLRDGMRLLPGNLDLMTSLVGVDLKASGIQAALATASSLAADPANLPAAASLQGDVLLAAKQPRDAAKAYAEAFNKAPSSTLAIKAATILAGTDQAQAAIDLLGKWVAGHPQDVEAQVQLAGLDLADHHLETASDHLKAALAVQPANVGALNNLAWISQQQGDLAGAASLAQRAYVHAPTPEVADTLGWILVHQNDTARALPLLAQGSAAPGRDQGARRYHYAYALNAAGRKDEAKALLQQAVATPAPFDEEADAKRLLVTLTN